MRADSAPWFARGWAQGWRSYALATLVGGAAVCAVWLLPLCDSNDRTGGPLMQQARQQQVLRIGVRSYPRPTLSNEALISEPDEMDTELAEALGHYLGIAVQLTALPSADIARFLESGTVDAVIVGSLEVSGLNNQRAALSKLPDAYRKGALLSLRNLVSATGSPVQGQTVCVAFGSPWAQTLQRQGAQLKTFPSNIRAATAFLAGDCRLLADERNVLSSLLQTPDWRFYRMLPDTLEANADAQVYLARPDQKSLKLLQAGLRDWQSKGGQAKAWDLHSNAFLVDSLKISDGLVCH